MTERLVSTVYHLLRTDGKRVTMRVEWPWNPDLQQLKALVEPLVGGRLDHVAVLYERRRADMFVNEDGHDAKLPRNELATSIYRHNWLIQHPHDPPEESPWIAGTAVLFERIVWR